MPQNKQRDWVKIRGVTSIVSLFLLLAFLKVLPLYYKIDFSLYSDVEIVSLTVVYFIIMGILIVFAGKYIMRGMEKGSW